MDALIERLVAANPARPAEFAGRADLASLPLPPRRRRRRLLAVPALVAVAGGFLLLPASSPRAGEIAQRATSVMAVDQGVLVAETHASRTSTSGESADYGTVRTWVSPKGMRTLQVTGRSDFPAGAQEVSLGGTITRYFPDGTTKTLQGSGVPGEVFRAGDLLKAAQARKGIDLIDETGDAYVLRWREPSGPPHFPVQEMTLWVAKDSYAPLKLTDHSWGLDVAGKPFDETLTIAVDSFQRLDDTPENERLLEYQGG
jgi:hypothetical protein